VQSKRFLSAIEKIAALLRALKNIRVQQGVCAFAEKYQLESRKNIREINDLCQSKN